MKNKKILAIAVLSAIIVFGFALRLYNLNEIPGVYPDEAVNGEDALRAISTGEFQWFYPANQGREGLFMNLVAVSFSFFGTNPMALKLPAVIIGMLTVLGMYFLSKELLGRRNIALIISFLYAVSFCVLIFNRISFRANMLPFILVWAFFFLFRGIKTEKIIHYAVGGFIFGLGMHTYIAFRVAPAVAIVLLAAFIAVRRNFLRDHWKPISVFLISSLLAASPMFYTFWQHPEYLESRSDNISIFSPVVNQGDLAGTFLKSFGLSLIKYNFVGDMNWRHNFPPYPLLDPIVGTAFLFGIIYSCLRFFKLLYARTVKKIRDDELVLHAFLLSWFFILLAPEFLTAEGNPHALRAIGALPAVFLFSGLTFQYLLKKAEKKGAAFRKNTAIIIIVILSVLGIFNAAKYHLIWVKRVETARAYERVLMNISNYIRLFPENTQKIIVTGSMQRIPIKIFNNTMPNLLFFYPEEIDSIKNSPSLPAIIILTEKNDEIIGKLRAKFPESLLEEKKDELGIVFYVLKK